MIAAERVEAALAAITETESTRDGLTLRLDGPPGRTYAPDGRLIGYDVMVKLFKGKTEIPIDPHRVFVNPPLHVVTGPPSFDWDEVLTVPAPTRQDPQAAFWDVLWQSVTETPNAKQWRTRGTVTTVFAGTSDGHLHSYATFGGSYSDARAGTTGSLDADSTSTTFTVGQDLPLSKFEEVGCYEGFLSFDTSAISDTDLVTQVDLSLWLTSDDSDTDFVVEAREYDWGASLTTADYVPGASLSGLTLLATLNSSGIGSTGSYKTFTSQAAFLSATNLKTGTVYLLLCSAEQTNNSAPANDERLTFSSANASGTTQDPRLVITHQAANVSSTGSMAMPEMAVAGTATSPFTATGSMALPTMAMAATGRWGSPFPGKPLPIKIELLINGAWIDISQYMYQRSDMVITYGRPDEASRVQTAKCSFTLNNRFKQFSPKYTGGAFYPFLTRNTQIRVSVGPTLSAAGTYYTGYRFWGEVPSWPPSWDKTGKDVYVRITANGLLRRLAQNSDSAGSALRRYYTKLTGSSAPAAYWPAEDANHSSQIASAVPGVAAMTVTGRPEYANDNSINGSGAFAQLNGSTWTGTPRAYNAGGSDIYTTPGTYIWTAPGDTTSLSAVECWGGGGGGGAAFDGPAPGGGGGEYAKETSVAVTPGTDYTLVVGAGGAELEDGGSSTFTADSVTIIAHGGSNGGLGLGGTGSSNTTTFDGGNGALGQAGVGGGGGGGSGGTGAAGNDGDGQDGGAAVTGGGPGGDGGAAAFCVDTATEIFTVAGWKHHDQVVNGDITLGLDGEGRIVQALVTRVRVFTGDFELLLLGNGAAATPSHRWPTPDGFKRTDELDVQGSMRADRVWCPTTSRGTWLARRGGRVFFTGNKP